MVAKLLQFQHSTPAEFAWRNRIRYTEPSEADRFDDLARDCGIPEGWERELWD